MGKKSVFLLGSLVFLALLYVVLFKIELARVSTFGCFDDCFNYVGGYFMLKGRQLYLEIFYNHQMLMAYISYGVQRIFQPQSIYELLVYHRMLVLAFSFLMNVLLTIRFRWVGIGFVLFYELTKYYLFGDRFLAESFIVYPLVYMLGIIWYSFHKKKVYFFDLLACSIFTWFVIFMREPYLLVAIVLYGVILWKNASLQKTRLALGFFVFLTFITLFSVPLADYIFNVFTVNRQKVISEGISIERIYTMFFYPIHVFFNGPWTLLRYLIVSLSVVFLISCWLWFKKYKKISFILLILFILGLSNVRTVTPGTMFYEAFHQIQWYGLFLAVVLFFLQSLFVAQKKFVATSIMLLAIVFGYAVFSPQSYLWDKIQRHEEFITNYGNYLSNGQVIKLLASPKDTLFADQIDDLLYWQADVEPAYKYSWYFGVMPAFPKYVSARLGMFEKYPPDFYYGYCPKQTNKSAYLLDADAQKYQQLYFAGRPTCLYVLKTKIATISKDRWEKIKQYEYHLPIQ